MKSEQINYQKAFEEIQKILEEIETGTVSIDELSEKVERASELMEVCRNKLKSTEASVQKILDKMSDGPNEEAPEE